MLEDEIFIANYSYQGQAPTELSFLAGDEIGIIQREGDDWWFGKTSNGQEVSSMTGFK